MSLLQAIMHFKQDFIEQLKQDSIGQHQLLKQTFIEELQPLKQTFIEERQSLKQDFIELRQSLKQTFIEQRQSLKQTFIEPCQSLRAIMPFKQNFIEQRQSPRESVQFTAWIDIGNGAALRDCTVLVADDGARIKVASPAELPNEFYLVLSEDGTRRRCRLVWRSDEEAGMSYLGPLEFGRL